MGETITIRTGAATEVIKVIEQGPQGPQGATGSGLGTLTTQGDTLYQGASSAQRLPIGTAGQILKVNSGGTAPEWGAAPASGVSSVNGETGAVTLDAADVNAIAFPNISSPSISGDTVLTASRNQLRYLTATGGTVANITLPYSGNQNGDICTLVAAFVGGSSVGQFTIRAAGQMAGGSPLGYSTLAMLLSSGESVSLVSDGSNGFGGWSIVAVGGNFPATSNAVQEYDVTGVLLPNGDNGSGVQLTRNTTTPQAPDGSDRTFNAEQLIYRRVSGTAQRLDTYLGVKLEWQPVAPTTPTTSGSTGQIAYADPYFYICVGVNNWKRVPVAAW
jgi:hypothetical protein